MASDNIQKIWLEDIERLEDKIQEIYYLEQFDIAKQFEQRLFDVKQKLISISDVANNSFGIDENEASLIKDIVAIEFEVDEFFRVKGNVIATKLNRNKYRNKVNELISNIDKKSTQESWSDLASILNEWNQIPHSETEKQETIKKVAKVSLKILEAQAKKGEQININAASIYCTQEDLLEAIQAKLIKIAQVQEEKNRRNTLDIAKNLTVENISNPVLWNILTNVDSVKISSMEKTDKQEEKSEQSTIALDVIKPKINWFDRVRKHLGMTTVYTFGDINLETGEWKNIKVKVGKFPLEMSDKKAKRLLAIEINDISEITREHGLSQYPNLQKVEFGTGVKIIGESALEGSTNLREAIIGQGVERIGDVAFGSCRNLRDVSLGQGLESIETGAFRGTGLEKIEIPDSVRVIGSNAFWSCRNLRDVSLGQGLESIETGAFSGTGLEKIEIPDSVRVIGSHAFCFCRNLRDVSLGQGLKSIGRETFRGTGLEKIKIPNNVKELGYYAFNDCENLTEVVIEQGVETIGAFAFKKTGLEKIEIPDSTKIGYAAFSDCKNLREARVGQEVKIIQIPFFPPKPEKTEVPATSKSLKNNVFMDCNNLKQVIIVQSVKKQDETIKSIELTAETIGKATINVPTTKKVQAEQAEIVKTEKGAKEIDDK